MTENEKQLNTRINDLEKKLDFVISLLSNTAAASAEESCEYTLYEWLEEWYNIYKVPKLAPGSLVQIKAAIEKHIKMNIEDKPLNKLSGMDIQKVLNIIKSSRTKKSVHGVFNGSIKQALKLEIISKNPMGAVDTVKHKSQQGSALTIEQESEFEIVIADRQHKPLYLFYLYTGCRRSEALRIKWTDVDFKNKTLHIPGTKTDMSDRILPLFDRVARLIKPLSKKTEYVFPYTWVGVKSAFEKLKKKYGLPYRLHDLRHTFATRCLEAGVAMKTIQKWLGHSKLDTTANIYTHVQSKFELNEVAKINEKWDTFSKTGRAKK